MLLLLILLRKCAVVYSQPRTDAAALARSHHCNCSATVITVQSLKFVASSALAMRLEFIAIAAPVQWLKFAATSHLRENNSLKFFTAKQPR